MALRLEVRPEERRFFEPPVPAPNIKHGITLYVRQGTAVEPCLSSQLARMMIPSSNLHNTYRSLDDLIGVDYMLSLFGSRHHPRLLLPVSTAEPLISSSYTYPPWSLFYAPLLGSKSGLS